MLCCSWYNHENLYAFTRNDSTSNVYGELGFYLKAPKDWKVCRACLARELARRQTDLGVCLCACVTHSAPTRPSRCSSWATC